MLRNSSLSASALVPLLTDLRGRFSGVLEALLPDAENLPQIPE